MYEFFRGKAWVCGHALVGMAKVSLGVLTPEGDDGGGDDGEDENENDDRGDEDENEQL